MFFLGLLAVLQMIALSSSSSSIISVSFSMTVTPNDAAIVQWIIPHAIRGCNYPFTSISVLIDPGRHKTTGDIQLLERELQSLVDAGTIHHIRRLSSDRQACDHLSRQFHPVDCKNIDHWNGDRGFLSFAQEIEDCETQYCVHLDSDILSFAEPNVSWVRQGLAILQHNEDVLVSMGRSGPKSGSGGSLTNVIPSRRGFYDQTRGFWSYNHMTTRFYVLNKAVFNKLLPLPWQHSIDWERLVSHNMQRMNIIRADLDSGDTWLIHFGNERSLLQPSILPRLLKVIEKGLYPESQVGKYDAVAARQWLDIIEQHENDQKCTADEDVCPIRY